MVSPEVFSTKNIIIGLEAVSFFGLISCNSSIAFRPIGVAALSSPNKLADMFMNIVPITGCPFGISGNILVNTGDSRRANSRINPPCSPIFMIPIHRESTPVSPMEISNAVLAESNVEVIKSGNTSVSPKNISRTSDTMKAMKKNAIQM